MDASKLKTLIDDKNASLEREALRTAENIIGSIVSHQLQIKKSQDAIAELRQELVALNITQLDPTEVLG